MSMNNVPPEQAQVAADMQAAQAAPVEEQPVMQQPEGEAVAAEAVAPEDQQAAQDEQVIEAVAEGLAEDQITASDIMRAIIADSLGVSAAGADQLLQLMLSELVDEEQPAEEIKTEVVEEEKPEE